MVVLCGITPTPSLGQVREPDLARFGALNVPGALQLTLCSTQGRDQWQRNNRHWPFDSACRWPNRTRWPHHHRWASKRLPARRSGLTTPSSGYRPRSRSGSTGFAPALRAWVELRQTPARRKKRCPGTRQLPQPQQSGGQWVG